MEEVFGIQPSANNNRLEDWLKATCIVTDAEKDQLLTFHQYKPEPNISTNPQGQLLISMVAAQKINQAKGINAPFYGVYVIGRFWFFILLEDTAYSESLAYDATQADLMDIYCILKKVKEYIDLQLG